MFLNFTLYKVISFCYHCEVICIYLYIIVFNISGNILFTTLQPNSFKHYRVKIIIMIMMMMIIIIINTIIIIIIIILFFFLSKAKG